MTANGTAFYYVVSAVGSDGLSESANFNEVVAQPVMLVPAIPWAWPPPSVRAGSA